MWSPANPPSKIALVFMGSCVILAGGLIGFLLTRMPATKSVKGTSSSVGSTMVNTATELGSTDTSTFKDTATGILDKGGLGQEGTHHLTRDGGPSQTVYLVSSLIDLDQLAGKKVQVWGITLKAKKAPWLMDVGRAKIVE